MKKDPPHTITDESKSREQLIRELKYLRSMLEVEREKVQLQTGDFEELGDIYKNITVGLCVFDLELRFLRINDQRQL